MSLTSHNPAKGVDIKSYPELTDLELEQKLMAADNACRKWHETPLPEKAVILRQAAKVLEENAEHYGKIITEEMGKPISQSISEVKKCGLNCVYYADNGEKLLTPEHIKTEYSESYVRFDPLGTILLIMPWNFPFWQVFRMAVPTIMAGNTVVLKHASNVPGCAIAIEEIWKKAGLPEGVFQTLLVGTDKVEKILRDDRIKGISLTGSENAGKSVAKIAGEEIKPVVMELGGSDPFIVFDDADLENALTCAATTRLLNAGQVCLAGKRFLVEESIYEEFLKRLKEIFLSYKVGDPMDKETTMGPLVSERARVDLNSQVERSIALGAELLVGGKKLASEGYFYAPTVLTSITTNMPVWQEETFGPVAAVMKFKTEEEAIELANNTRYGLSAALFTKSSERIQKFVSALEVGTIYVNDLVKSDPRFPIGGIKKSGLGRELGESGIKAFINVKTVVVK